MVYPWDTYSNTNRVKLDQTTKILFCLSWKFTSTVPILTPRTSKWALAAKVHITYHHMTISVAIRERQGALYGVEVNGKSYKYELYNITITIERTLFGSKQRLTLNRCTPLAEQMHCQYLEPFFSAKVHIISKKHRPFWGWTARGILTE